MDESCLSLEGSLPKFLRRSVENLARDLDRIVNQDFIRLAKSDDCIVYHVESHKSKRILMVRESWGAFRCLINKVSSRVSHS